MNSSLPPAGGCLLLALVIAIVTLTGSQAATPPTPVFADNYHVHGLLSLPYAELNEPFNAYFDKQGERSRADYYQGEYQVYQFGPKGSPSGSDATQYGAIYKLVYVPRDFHQSTGRLRDTSDESPQTPSERRHLETSRTPVKRVCFGTEGAEGFTIGPQSVLPVLRDFTYDSTGRCPHVAGSEHRAAKCELWKYSNEVGEKKNLYKFWVRREANVTIPVHYYMLGYDSLLGSHYDRYDISYWRYEPNGARDTDFKLDVKGKQCAPMPGPGESEAARRAHLVQENPIHQFVEQPHKYAHIDHHWAAFKEQFGRQRDPAGDRQGWFHFLHNLRFIHAKNRQLKEYKLAVNKYADVGRQELRYLRGKLPSTGGYNGGLDYAANHNLKANGQQQMPDYYDWTVLGAVTPVKDQAVCGSCWSFGTVGTIEGNYFARTGKLLRLSQQQLVDCSWQFGNNGCDGGEDFRAYAYIKQAGGLATEEDYGHYRGIDGKCRDQDVSKAVRINGFYNVTSNSVEALKHALINYGPVSISIDASQPTFTFYSHGAYFDEKCQNSPDSLDHSVLLVGYTKIDGKLVWKVKNSWSTYWGNDGYIYMLAEQNNCGVLDSPTVPIISN